MNPKPGIFATYNKSDSVNNDNAGSHINNAFINRIASLEYQILKLCIWQKSRDISSRSRSRSRSHKRYNPYGKLCYFHYLVGRSKEFYFFHLFLLSFFLFFLSFLILMVLFHGDELIKFLKFRTFCNLFIYLVNFSKIWSWKNKYRRNAFVFVKFIYIFRFFL